GTMTMYIDPPAKTGDIGILVGHVEARGRGFGREAWGLAMDYLFRVEGLDKVTGGTVMPNVAMLGVFRHWNMRLEGVQKNSDVVDDTPTDVLRFGMLRREWEQARPRAIALGEHGR